MDSADRLRVDEAREDLHRLLTEHELWDAPLLVMANKQDDPRAMQPREITEKLQLYSLANRNWYIVDTRATHSDIVDSNLHAGLDWVVETLGTPAAMRQVLARARAHPARGLAWRRLCGVNPGARRRRRGWSTTSALRREMRSMRRRRRARARARASKRSAPGEHARL